MHFHLSGFLLAAVTFTETGAVPKPSSISKGLLTRLTTDSGTCIVDERGGPGYCQVTDTEKYFCSRQYACTETGRICSFQDGHNVCA
ncbi:hypothetical protein F4778DRAFT_741868 [Xylariomycetidae sp. FL2044]|nr:hypothetical protein F4778DRAFT_741868 [Xylariomycetidae sp. FL2044]